MTCKALRKKPMRQPHPASRRAGVVLLALLLALALMGIALLGASEWWNVARQREAEADLLYAGDQYRKAIEHYYRATPATLKTYPTRIEDLIEDPRFPTPVRHLRRLYRDPVTGEAFDLIRADEDIVGVASSSTRQPLKRKNFPPPYGAFADQDSYSQWKFVFRPPQRGRPARELVPASPANRQINGVNS